MGDWVGEDDLVFSESWAKNRRDQNDATTSSDSLDKGCGSSWFPESDTNYAIVKETEHTNSSSNLCSEDSVKSEDVWFVRDSFLVPSDEESFVGSFVETEDSSSSVELIGPQLCGESRRDKCSQNNSQGNSSVLCTDLSTVRDTGSSVDCDRSCGSNATVDLDSLDDLTIFTSFKEATVVKEPVSNNVVGKADSLNANTDNNMNVIPCPLAGIVVGNRFSMKESHLLDRPTMSETSTSVSEFESVRCPVISSTGFQNHAHCRDICCSSDNTDATSSSVHESQTSGNENRTVFMCSTKPDAHTSKEFQTASDRLTAGVSQSITGYGCASEDDVWNTDMASHGSPFMCLPLVMTGRNNCKSKEGPTSVNIQRLIGRMYHGMQFIGYNRVPVGIAWPQEETGYIIPNGSYAVDQQTCLVAPLFQRHGMLGQYEGSHLFVQGTRGDVLEKSATKETASLGVTGIAEGNRTARVQARECCDSKCINPEDSDSCLNFVVPVDLQPSPLLTEELHSASGSQFLSAGTQVSGTNCPEVVLGTSSSDSFHGDIIFSDYNKLRTNNVPVQQVFGHGNSDAEPTGAVVQMVDPVTGNQKFFGERSHRRCSLESRSFCNRTRIKSDFTAKDKKLKVQGATYRHDSVQCGELQILHDHCLDNCESKLSDKWVQDKKICPKRSLPTSLNCANETAILTRRSRKSTRCKNFPHSHADSKLARNLKIHDKKPKKEWMKGKGHGSDDGVSKEQLYRNGGTEVLDPSLSNRVTDPSGSCRHVILNQAENYRQSQIKFLEAGVLSKNNFPLKTCSVIVKRMPLRNCSRNSEAGKCVNGESAPEEAGPIGSKGGGDTIVPNNRKDREWVKATHAHTSGHLSPPSSSVDASRTHDMSSHNSGDLVCISGSVTCDLLSHKLPDQTEFTENGNANHRGQCRVNSRGRMNGVLVPSCSVVEEHIRDGQVTEITREDSENSSVPHVCKGDAYVSAGMERCNSQSVCTAASVVETLQETERESAVLCGNKDMTTHFSGGSIGNNENVKCRRSRRLVDSRHLSKQVMVSGNKCDSNGKQGKEHCPLAAHEAVQDSCNPGVPPANHVSSEVARQDNQTHVYEQIRIRGLRRTQTCKQPQNKQICFDHSGVSFSRKPIELSRTAAASCRESSQSSDSIRGHLEGAVGERVRMHPPSFQAQPLVTRKRRPSILHGNSSGLPATNVTRGSEPIRMTRSSTRKKLTKVTSESDVPPDAKMFVPGMDSEQDDDKLKTLMDVLMDDIMKIDTHSKDLPKRDTDNFSFFKEFVLSVKNKTPLHDITALSDFVLSIQDNTTALRDTEDFKKVSWAFRKPKHTSQAASSTCRLMCSVCRKSFSREERLQVHSLLHPCCKLCGKNCCTKKALDVHSKSCRRQLQKCHVNGNGFAVESKNQEEKKDFSCHLCKMKFKNVTLLKQHLRKHSYKCPYLCRYCSARFKWQTSLAAHTLTHMRHSQVTCNTCSASFSNKGGLARHLKKYHHLSYHSIFNRKV